MVCFQIKRTFSLFFCVLLALCIAGCREEAEMIEIDISVSTYIGERLTYIAYDRGFFKEQGLDVNMKINSTGWESLKELFESKADICSTAELPVIYSAFDKTKYTSFPRKDFYILGDMVFSQNNSHHLIARRDRGIETPEDLRGKRVAVYRGTTVDYYMDMFLREYRIDESELEIVNMGVPENVDALVNGEVDAAFTWQPHGQNAMERLGDDGQMLTSSFKYSNAWLIVTDKEFAHENPQVLIKYLSALTKAERFISENQQEAQEIYSRLSGIDEEITRKTWDLFTSSLSLSRGLIYTMNGAADWMIRKGMYPPEEKPDFNHYFYTEAMEEAKPEGLFLNLE
jgi:NitT/TauT family transport system substrate-binding protein